MLVERLIRGADDAPIAEALLARVRATGVSALPWRDPALRLRQRLAFAHRHFADAYPSVSDAALLGTLDEWLAPALAGMRRLNAQFAGRPG